MKYNYFLCCKELEKKKFIKKFIFFEIVASSIFIIPEFYTFFFNCFIILLFNITSLVFASILLMKKRFDKKNFNYKILTIKIFALIKLINSIVRFSYLIFFFFYLIYFANKYYIYNYKQITIYLSKHILIMIIVFIFIPAAFITFWFGLLEINFFKAIFKKKKKDEKNLVDKKELKKRKKEDEKRKKEEEKRKKEEEKREKEKKEKEEKEMKKREKEEEKERELEEKKKKEEEEKNSATIKSASNDYI